MKKILVKMICLVLMLSLIFGIGALVLNKERTELSKVEENNPKQATPLTVVPSGYTGIYNATDLVNIANNMNGRYILMADINMSGVSFTPIGRNVTEDEVTDFTGILDGNYHKISNLTIDTNDDYACLFANVRLGTIKNLTIENESLKHTSKPKSGYDGSSWGWERYVSFLTGSSSGAKFENINVTGTSKIELYNSNTNDGDLYVGGIVGIILGDNDGSGNITSGSLKDCTVNANVTIDDGSRIYLGGLIGRKFWSEVKTSTTNLTVTINNGAEYCYIGGAVAELGRSTTDTQARAIDECTSTLVVNANGENSHGAIGGIVGKNYMPEASVYNCTANATIKMNGKFYYEDIGGGVGNGKIENSSATTKIEIGNYEIDSCFIGGLVGFGTSINSHVVVDIDVASNAEFKNTAPYINSAMGGLAGGSKYVEKSYAHVDIKINGTINKLGALVGYTEGTNDSRTKVKESYTVGNIDVNRATHLGGLVGYALKFDLTDAYSNTNVKANYMSYGGALCGYSGGECTFTNCYNAGLFDYTGADNIGLIGSSYSTVTHCYYEPYLFDKEDGNYDDFSPLGEEKTLRELSKKSTFEEWNFSGVWKITEDVTTPYLLNNKRDDLKISEIQNKIDQRNEETGEPVTTVPEGFTGIYNQTDLANIKNNLSGKYILMADINISGSFTLLAADTAFSGEFDGNYHKISNLNITSSNYAVGLFAETTGATIKNLELSNFKLKSTNTDRNPMVGCAAGKATGSKFTGVRVTGTSTVETEFGGYLGGVVGYSNPANFDKCYSEVKSIFTNIRYVYVGGIAGYGGTIKNSSANITYTNPGSADYTYYTYLGGITGDCRGNIKNCTADVKLSIDNATRKYLYFGGIAAYKQSGVDSFDVKDCNANVEFEAKNNATVQNSNIGGILASVSSDIVVSNCDTNYNVSIDNTVITDYNYYGGIVACELKGTIEKSHSTVDFDKTYNSSNVHSDYALGGILGRSSEGTITECNADFNAVLNTVSNTGGIFGTKGGSGSVYIEKSYAKVDIDATNSLYTIGGIAGCMTSSTTSNHISEVYAIGNIVKNSGKDNSSLYCGGLIGSTESTEIENAYANVNISGNGFNEAGTFVGYFDGGNIRKIYTIGKIDVTNLRYRNNITEVGATYASHIYDSYWAPQLVEKLSDVELPTPKTVEEMMHEETFTNWDFDDVWSIDEGESFPYLLGNKETAITKVQVDERLQVDSGVAIVKVYEAGTTTPIQGVEIALCDSTGTVLQNASEEDAILTTDENGEVDFIDIYPIAPNTTENPKYYYKQVSVPDGYGVNSTIYEFSINNKKEITYGSNNGIIYTNKSYTVTLNTNGGTINSGNITKYVAGQSTTLPTDVTKEDFVFDGWYVNSDFSGNSLTTITSSESGDKTFYAKWKAIAAKIGDNVYYSLQDAINAVPTDGTETEIIMHADVVEHLRIEGNRNVVIDVNGHTIRGSIVEVSGAVGSSLQNIFNIIGDGEGTETETSEPTILIEAGSRLRLKGQGKVISDDGAAVENNGTFILDPSVELISNCKDPALQNNGDATINGGKVINTTDGPAIVNEKDATLDINGGEIHSEEGTAIINKGELTVGGGKITNNSADDPTIDNYGKATINDGEVENLAGGTAIKNRETGELDINGGKIIGDPAVDNSEGGELNISEDADIQGDVVGPTFTVTFKNNGQVVDTQNVEYGKAATAPTLTKAGYTLSWDRSFTNITEDIEINAVWTANTDTPYKIEYYLRNKDEEVEGYDLATSETEHRTGTTDTTVSLTKSDYKFITGFTCDGDNTNNVITDIVRGDGSTTLKLYYSRNSYSITYELNGGSGNDLSDTYMYGKEFVLSRNVTKSNMVFDGWYDNPEFTGQEITKIAEGTAEDMTFYAKWKDEEQIKLGDINGDGNITLIDLSLINQAIVGKITLNNIQKVAADLNKDGHVTLIDLSLINQVIVGKYTL